MFYRALFCTLVPLWLALPAPAAQTNSLPTGPAADIPTNAPIRQIGPGLFRIGSVTLDKNKRTVQFPAAVNLLETPIEYLVVADYGKVHESVLRTETQPYEIHLAMLLLGARGSGTNPFPADATTPLPGEPLELEILWSTNHEPRRARGESFVYSRQDQGPLAETKWTYTGSILLEGSFLAQQEGSIISLINDPVSLVNYPGPLRLLDENWRPHREALPPVESMVTVRLKLLKPAPPDAPE